MKKTQVLQKTYLSMTRGAIYLLLILFVLGMIANLYIEIPAGGNAWAWVFGHSAVIALHAIFGTLLLLIAIFSLIWAFRSHRSTWILGSVFGLLFTVLAAYSGSNFLSAGQSNLSSLLMAFGFLGALVSYALAVFQTKVVKEI